MDLKRGDIVLVDFEPVKGSEQRGIRPSLIIQNDIGNEHSPLTIIAPITSNIENIYPVNVTVYLSDDGDHFNIRPVEIKDNTDLPLTY